MLAPNDARIVFYVGKEAFFGRNANNSDHDDFKQFTQTSKAHEI